jgi:hypothetical protein
MGRRVPQGKAGSRESCAGVVPALAVALALLGATAARAQYHNPSEPGDYKVQPHPGEDAIAIGFLEGRFTTPVTCKRSDGTSIEVPMSMVFKGAPESAGGDVAKVTFFGVDVADAVYCYSLIERRIVDRRGTILLRYRSYNRTDLGISDFRRALKAGPLTYNASEGEISERGIGTDPGDVPTRTLSFAGGDSRLVLHDIPNGSDGAKLLDRFRPVPEGAKAEDIPRRFGFHFIAKDGTEFTLYAVEEFARKRQQQ